MRLMNNLVLFNVQKTSLIVTKLKYMLSKLIVS